MARDYRCPRCDVPLVDYEFHGTPISVCGACDGALLPQLRMVGLVDKLVDELLGDGVATVPCGPPREDVVGEADCPKCARAMERFDYLGKGAVNLDKCSRCRLLWLDADELDAVVGIAAELREEASYRPKIEVRVSVFNHMNRPDAGYML